MKEEKEGKEGYREQGNRRERIRSGWRRRRGKKSRKVNKEKQKCGRIKRNGEGKKVERVMGKEN